jgi:hypothetical protein
MAQEKAEYEVNEEFNVMAMRLVEKYPVKFDNIDVSKMCCVNITNKTRKEKEGSAERIWKLQSVKMPVAIHCQYSWYTVLYSQDWEDLSDKHKAALVADVLHGIPNEIDNEGGINPCDTKGYLSIFKTLGIDYLDDPDIPDLLDAEKDVEWK